MTNFEEPIDIRTLRARPVAPAEAPELPEDLDQLAALAALGAKTFQSLAPALRYVVTELIPKRHRYIVHVSGPGGPLAQFVNAARVFRTTDPGLALWLTFEPGSAELGRFLELPASGGFRGVPWDGVACFARGFGVDVGEAEAAFLAVALAVFLNPDALHLTATVWNEGPRRRAKNR